MLWRSYTDQLLKGIWDKLDSIRVQEYPSVSSAVAAPLAA